MKTKTLFFSLLAGAFLCFSNASYAQYHNGGGSGDGVWDQGTMALNVGVGFIGSGLGNVVGAGYTSSVSPAFEISFERGLSEHWGIGLGISYQSATSTYTSSYATYVFNPSTFTETPVTYTTTDKYTLSLLSFNVRGAYHFSAGAKFDPYVALALGYCTASESDNETSNDPNNVSTSGAGSSITGLEYGVIGGARYLFTDHIGAWIELQYLAASFSYGGYSSTINAGNVINLGISFKF